MSGLVLPRLDAGAIKRELDARLVDLVHAMLGAPNKALSTKHDLRYGSRGSLSVDLAGRVWFDHEQGVGGDVLDLVQHHVGVDFSGALAWASDWLGGAADMPPARRPTCANDADREKQDRRNLEVARTIWKQSQPVTPDTTAWKYLEGRGLALADGVPLTLRYHPTLRHTPTGLDFPALVGAMTVWPTREIVAVHRTFLKPNGSGKAAVSTPKMRIGRAKGAALRLGPAADELIVCEGIEDGLSIMQIKPGAAVWVGAGTGSLCGMKLPDMPLAAHVVIAADADSAGQITARKAAKIWKAEGRTVESATPPVGKDWNAYLQKDMTCQAVA